MTTTALDLPDLRDPELYLDGIPHDLFTRLRRECPVYWNPEPDDPRHEGFWAVTKYDDIVAISKNPKVFSSDSEWGDFAGSGDGDGPDEGKPEDDGVDGLLDDDDFNIDRF